MIAFASLFLGLVVGTHPVELLVGDDVAQVVVQLDGREISRLVLPPWHLDVDLGDTIAPHRLDAIALDAKGAEIARARQWINLPRAPAAVSIALEGDDPRRPRAGTVRWQHLALRDAERVRVTVDGRLVPVDAQDRFTLPDLDPESVHTLVAQVAFPDGTRYQAEVRFGGPAGGRIDAELTGVLVDMPAPMAQVGALTGRFQVHDRPARVVAVEKTAAKLIVVVDHHSIPGLRELAPFDLGALMPMPPGQELSFLFPVVQRVGGRGSQAARLFQRSRTYTAEDGDLGWLLTRIRAPEPQPDQALTDALVAAALEAADGHRPRAVVLMLGRAWEDRSAFRVDEALGYFRDLQVPLVIWTIRRGAGSRSSEDRFSIHLDTPWGQARDISSVNRIVSAAAALRTRLDRQRTVWLEGAHLPQAVSVLGEPPPVLSGNQSKTFD